MSPLDFPKRAIEMHHVQGLGDLAADTPLIAGAGGTQLRGIWSKKRMAKRLPLILDFDMGVKTCYYQC